MGNFTIYRCDKLNSVKIVRAGESAWIEFSLSSSPSWQDEAKAYYDVTLFAVDASVEGFREFISDFRSQLADAEAAFLEKLAEKELAEEAKL